MVQEAGYTRLRAGGIDLIAADKPDAFTDDSPTARMVRQILGAVAEFDKAMTVAKLRGARERKRRKTGAKVEGRKTYAEKRSELVALARELARPPKALREVRHYARSPLNWPRVATQRRRESRTARVRCRRCLHRP